MDEAADEAADEATAAAELTDEAAADVALEAGAAAELDAPLPVGVSPDRMQPVLSVRALGQVTCL